MLTCYVLVFSFSRNKNIESSASSSSSWKIVWMQIPKKRKKSETCFYQGGKIWGSKMYFHCCVKSNKLQIISNSNERDVVQESCLTFVKHSGHFSFFDQWRWRRGGDDCQLQGSLRTVWNWETKPYEGVRGCARVLVYLNQIKKNWINCNSEHFSLLFSLS